MTFDEAKRILAALEAAQVKYVLIGSMAMAAHGVVRATRDMDFFLAPDRENIDRTKAALQSLFHDPAIDEISAEELAGDYPAIQYVPPDGAFSLDLLTRLGEAYGFEDIEAQTLRIDGQDVRVATPRMLYLMKRDTMRPQDKIDAAALRLRFQLEEP